MDQAWILHSSGNIRVRFAGTFTRLDHVMQVSLQRAKNWQRKSLPLLSVRSAILRRHHLENQSRTLL
jgi:hypothetical protein